MDIQVENKITNCESLFNRKKKMKEALALTARYWTMYIVSEDDQYLHKANHTAVSMFNLNNGSMELCLSSVFFHIQSESYDRAEDLLDSMHIYRNYFKNNEPFIYSWFIYLSALLQIRKNKTRSALKLIKSLEGFIEDHHNSLSLAHLGSLKFEAGKPMEALSLFSASFKMGSRKNFLFVQLYILFKSGVPLQNKENLLIPVINWSIAQGAFIGDLINEYREQIDFSSCNNLFVLEKIYNVSRKGIVLEEIVKRLIKHSDYSNYAYQYYREAEAKQIFPPQLYDFMIKSACRNGVDDVSRYTMKQFLASGEMDVTLKAFVYHLLLSDKKMQEFSEEHTNEIIQFSFYCLENNMTGRYYNSLYRNLIRTNEKISVEYIQRIEKSLLENIFTYQIVAEHKGIKHVWVIEKEKKDIVMYDLVDGSAIVKSADEFFSYICFDSGQKEIINGQLRIVKWVENADIELYLYFYHKGIKTPDLIISLAKHIMALEEPVEESIDILNDALALKNSSHSFKMLASAALGNVLYTQNRLDLALEYYKGVDENYLNDKYIEQMLTVFTNAKEFERAIALISKKSHCISDRVLFSSLKQISLQQEFKHRIADTAYELILKSWYDKALLDIVLSYYKGSQEQWQELSKVLTSISAAVDTLDEIILKNSIWMHKFDIGSQKVYLRMYENSPENELVGLFTYYCIYEIIINGVKPEYETIGVLEKIFLEFNDKLLAYCLSILYLEKDLTTIHSDDVIKKAIAFAEQDGIMFPIFKNCKDKKFSTPYIEKNQPFVYRSLPNKDIYLYFKTDAESEFKQVKMNYFRFGMYTNVLPHFYGETITYYISEEMPTGSIVTKESEIENNQIYLNESSDDPYFVINNALVYEQMFKYEQVEKIIAGSLKDLCKIKGEII